LSWIEPQCVALECAIASNFADEPKRVHADPQSVRRAGSPTQALALGLKVDVNAVPPPVAAALRAERSI
jgi:hypothetical protein